MTPLVSPIWMGAFAIGSLFGLLALWVVAWIERGVK